ncbi:hypothetical protein [Mannheimia varigena]|uniref:Uncharacterized protein n=1 Tax=Mannheimia varigena USDA-ARS-USMARC-1296 TaxID=1433287 RepID=W0QEB9_9PAST|nr:hypothetical protein [Mannheimia varigena]AHG76632.1 hypothetical protein X808_21140 [Mannheimia varigena USDA-ARS-USMARC-1296]AHG78614.1 hypothetical protein X874_19810 [Mannheimia varigena USDA-ARS-USMARC-1312]AHG78633.1 hypothetical protein X875_110 [Mannheimia varigena USDA-ARS-USMARC-1388]TLU75890.1 hypothetical protein FE589_05165 [Mannheimia varigena]
MIRIILLIAVGLAVFMGASYLTNKSDKATENAVQTESTSQTATPSHVEATTAPLPPTTKEEAVDQPKTSQPEPTPEQQQALPEEQSLEGHQEQPAEQPKTN